VDSNDEDSVNAADKVLKEDKLEAEIDDGNDKVSLIHLKVQGLHNHVRKGQA
jgi:hypothetical protein